jgi:hypothetical protein
MFEIFIFVLFALVIAALIYGIFKPAEKALSVIDNIAKEEVKSDPIVSAPVVKKTAKAKTPSKKSKK